MGTVGFCASRRSAFFTDERATARPSRGVGSGCVCPKPVTRGECRGGCPQPWLRLGQRVHEVVVSSAAAPAVQPVPSDGLLPETIYRLPGSRVFSSGRSKRSVAGPATEFEGRAPRLLGVHSGSIRSFVGVAARDRDHLFAGLPRPATRRPRWSERRPADAQSVGSREQGTVSAPVATGQAGSERLRFLSKQCLPAAVSGRRVPAVAWGRVSVVR